MYWHFKVLVDHVLAPNPFLGKKEELEALKGELNGSRQQLHLVAQVGFFGWHRLVLLVAQVGFWVAQVGFFLWNRLVFSWHRLVLVAQVGFGGICPYGRSGSLVLLPTC